MSDERDLYAPHVIRPPRCPRCRGEEIEPLPSSAKAKWDCLGCALAFVGSLSEWDAMDDIRTEYAKQHGASA